MFSHDYIATVVTSDLLGIAKFFRKLICTVRALQYSLVNLCLLTGNKFCLSYQPAFYITRISQSIVKKGEFVKQ